MVFGLSKYKLPMLSVSVVGETFPGNIIARLFYDNLTNIKASVSAYHSMSSAFQHKNV